jgi:hypothetical protein
MYNHNAVFKAYPNVVSFDDGAGAFDANGNQIELDQALVDAAAAELAAEARLLPNTNATANLSTPHWQLLLTPCTGRTKAITPNLTSTTQRVPL